MKRIILIIAVISTVISCERKSPSFVNESVSISPQSGIYNHPIAILLSSNKDVPIFYSINSQPVHQYKSALNLSKDGVYTMLYGASDGLTLPVVWASATFTIDTIPPILTMNPAPGTYNRPVDVSITSNEPAAIFISVALAPFTAYTASIQVPYAEYFTIQAYAVDLANNKSTITGGTYAVNIPDISIVSPVNGSVFPSNISIPFSASAYGLYGPVSGTSITWYTSNGILLGSGITIAASFLSGGYTVYAVASNTAGFSSTASVNITTSGMLFSTYSNPNIISGICSDGTNIYGVGNGGLSAFDINGNPEGFMTVDQGLPTNMLRACAFDNGNLYITSDYGLIVSGSTGISISNTSNSNIPTDNLFSIYNDAPDGELWLSSYSSVMYLSNGGFNIFQTPLFITYTFLRDITDGTMWFGGAEGIVHSTTTGWVTYTTDNTPALPSDAVISLTEDSLGTIGIGTFPFMQESGGAALFTPSTNTWFTLTTQNGLPSNNIVSAVFDQSNRFIINTFSTVSVFTNDTLTNFTAQASTSNGLSINNVTWFGTDGNGLLKYDGNSNGITYTSLNSPFIMSNDVKAMAFSPDGTVYVGTDIGINAVNNNHILYTILTPSVNAIEYYNGCIYAGTDQGLLAICGNAKAVYLNGITVNTLLVPWIGTNAGLYYYTGSAFTNYTYQNTAGGLLSDTVNGIAYGSNGKVYIGTSSGLSVFDGTGFYPAQGASFKWVNSMASYKDGSLWLNTDQGVCNYNGSSPSCFIFPGSVNNLIVDGKNNLWISTNNGFYKYDGYTLLFYPPQLPVPDSLINTISASPSGAKYIGTDAGLCIYKGD